MLTVLGMGICCPNPEILNIFGVEGGDVDKNLLPPGIRRRASLNSRMAITAAHDACQQAGVNPAALPGVFASLGGEMQVTDALCLMLPDQATTLSPTLFHNSVHNTTAGYWSIIAGSRQPITALAAEYDTFALGLVEAWGQLQFDDRPLLFVCYDEIWPQYLCPPIGREAFACAFVLAGDGGNREGELGKIGKPRLEKGADQQIGEALFPFVEAAPAAVSIPLAMAIQQRLSKNSISLSIGGYDWVLDFTV